MRALEISTPTISRTRRKFLDAGLWSGTTSRAPGSYTTTWVSFRGVFVAKSIDGSIARDGGDPGFPRWTAMAIARPARFAVASLERRWASHPLRARRPGLVDEACCERCHSRLGRIIPWHRRFSLVKTPATDTNSNRLWSNRTRDLRDGEPNRRTMGHPHTSQPIFRPANPVPRPASAPHLPDSNSYS